MEIVINKGDGEDGENGDNGGDAQTRGLHYLNGTGEKARRVFRQGTRGGRWCGSPCEGDRAGTSCLPGW